MKRNEVESREVRRRHNNKMGAKSFGVIVQAKQFFWFWKIANFSIAHHWKLLEIRTLGLGVVDKLSGRFPFTLRNRGLSLLGKSLDAGTASGELKFKVDSY